MRGQWQTSKLARRLGWSFGAASLWTWGLLVPRMVRDGPLPLEVWFSYGLSFLMTSTYVYFGLLIVAVFRVESAAADSRAAATDGLSGQASRLKAAWRPVSLIGLAGLALALGSIGAWIFLRYPGQQAVPGTMASVVLALMILGVSVVGTLLARERAP
jgi:hypothetical protein